MRSGRFRLWCQITAVVLSVFGSMACGDDDSSRPDGSRHLADSLAAVQALKSFTVDQTTSITGVGQPITLNLLMTLEPPDRAYARTNSGDIRFEMVILGTQAFTREGGQAWTSTTLLQLGFDPASLYKTFDLAQYAAKVEVIDQPAEAGVDLIHIRAKLQGEEMLEALASFLSDNNAVADVLAQADVKMFEVDYFLDRNSKLPRRGEVRFEYEVQGSTIKATSKFRYYDYNVPISYPAGLPLP